MANHVLSLEVPDTMNKCLHQHCANIFSRIRATQKFCSNSCCRADKRLKKGRWVFSNEVILCKGCQESFIKTSKSKVYCAITCSKVYLGKDYYIANREKWRSEEAKIKQFNRSPYKKYRKSTCEACGFIPVNICQLDVDHIDGNHNNNDLSNLQTLCANCHRLKGFLNNDYRKQVKIIKLCSTY